MSKTTPDALRYALTPVNPGSDPDEAEVRDYVLAPDMGCWIEVDDYLLYIYRPYGRPGTIIVEAHVNNPDNTFDTPLDTLAITPEAQS